MKFFIEILDRINSLVIPATTIEESWAYINLTGNSDADCCTKMLNLNQTLAVFDCDNALVIRIDNHVVEKEELSDYSNAPGSFSTWKISLNKLAIIGRRLDPGFNTNFFFSSGSCQTWLNKLTPLDDSSPINQLSPLKIVIKDLAVPFGGEHLYFIPADEKYFSLAFKNPIILPGKEKVKENVHYITNFKVDFDPNTYVITNGDFSSDLSQSVLKQSSLLLASCLVDEFYSNDKIVINGLKLTTLKLFDSNDTTYDFSFYKSLIDLTHWVYEDRTSTRKKLFYDRLTLECNPEHSYIKSLQIHALSALRQAKDRYNFVILDRKDAYIKELKELLKDLRAQSDLYSNKIRSLLTSFLRDVLAGIILIGFTIFTKFTDNIGLDKNKLLEYVFYGLAIYYLVSILMQAIVDWVDIDITNRELKYWKRASKELIPENEFTKHLKDSLGPRRRSFRILYPLVSILYLALAFACFRYPTFFQNLILQN